MTKLTIDGLEIEVEAGSTIMQAADYAGIEIPRFCYHERLAIAGNCRMCLVEIEKLPKLAASCAIPVSEGMIVHTKSESVKKAREGVLELLLINHPLDCPICDQGGECDLQDEAVAYGSGESRYCDEKRAVDEKDFGPLVKGTMTRCIHCTRCIRFVTDVAGVPELGGIGRGEHMEVSTYVSHALTSELSGNIVDLCPVGALTSKPYAFTARPWELRKTESIDILDALGSAIRVDSRGNQVMRILPRINDDINEEWLGDKSRHAVDGLTRQRLDRPYVRRKGKLEAVSWDVALETVASHLKKTAPDKIAALTGDLTDVESLYVLKSIMNHLGSPHLDCRIRSEKLEGPRSSYIFNSTIAGIDQADFILMIGTNPRHEAPVLNARIRKKWLQGDLKIALIGHEVDLTYDYDYLGNDASLLDQISQGHHSLSAEIKAAQRPMIIVGQGALSRPDGGVIVRSARTLSENLGLVRDDWNGFNILHVSASLVGGLDIGFLPGPKGRNFEGILSGTQSGDIEFVYLLGVDSIDMSRLGKAFVVYQGHHGDAGASRADVILPGAAYTEKEATFVNTEGRIQFTHLAIFPPGEAKTDWKILRALGDRIAIPLTFDDLGQLRQEIALNHPLFASPETIISSPWADFGEVGTLSTQPFEPVIDNYYMTDVISRSSPTMAQCTASLMEISEKRTGTNG